ncbi:MAG TPA: MobA/MobL family protein [Luteimonas sp.]|nr:MobA/MobL family protein [Luteimonas sp.]
MAIYHTRVKVFQRSKADSSTAAAAYRAGLLLVNPRTGETHDYRRRRGVIETRCFAPLDAPKWSLSPDTLWPAVEINERRKDSVVGREFEVALPHELTDDQRSDLVWDICRDLVNRYQFAVQASIHAPATRDGLNYHAHILATTRRMRPDGLKDKTKELDGGPSGISEIEWVREMVAARINDHLAQAQVVARVDHRSLATQYEDAMRRGDLVAAALAAREPTQPMGRHATALHRRGIDSDRAAENKAIIEANEASFQDLVADLEREGRLAHTSSGHSHEGARRDRLAAVPELSPVPGEGQIHLVRGMPRSGLGPAHPAPSPADRERATRQAFAEAAALWLEGFVETINATFKATKQLVRHHAARVDAFGHLAGFRSDVRELLRRLKQLKHHALRFRRRLEAQGHAQHLLDRAEHELSRFDSQHPKPGLWTRREWEKRRARRVSAVELSKRDYGKAEDATGPEAQRRYDELAIASAHELETFAQSMLKRFPVETDTQPSPEVDASPAPIEVSKPPSRIRPLK